MECHEIASILDTKISLYKHLGLELLAISDDHAHFRAQLGENLNHKNTAFGGSLYTVAVLAAYSLVFAALKRHGIVSEDIIIAKGEMRYLRPVTTDFEAFCEFPTDEALEQFLRNLRKRGGGRQELVAQILSQGKVCAELTGLFIVKV